MVTQPNQAATSQSGSMLPDLAASGTQIWPVGDKVTSAATRFDHRQFIFFLKGLEGFVAKFDRPWPDLVTGNGGVRG